MLTKKVNQSLSTDGRRLVRWLGTEHQPIVFERDPDLPGIRTLTVGSQDPAEIQYVNFNSVNLRAKI